MKKGLHPEYHSEAKIICACGNEIIVGSTKAEMQIEICGACHPFYTGKKKMVDTTGRVDRFKKRMEKAAELKSKTGAKKVRKKKAKETEEIQVEK